MEDKVLIEYPIWITILYYADIDTPKVKEYEIYFCLTLIHQKQTQLNDIIGHRTHYQRFNFVILSFFKCISSSINKGKTINRIRNLWSICYWVMVKLRMKLFNILINIFSNKFLPSQWYYNWIKSPSTFQTVTRKAFIASIKTDYCLVCIKHESCNKMSFDIL